MKRSRYYVESGRYDPVGLAKSLGLGVLAALLTGAIYGYLDWINPFLFINVLGTMAVAFAVSIGVGGGARWGHVRNARVAGVVGLLAGLLALWVSWVAWIWALTEHQALVVLPSSLWEVITFVNAEGAWSFKDTTPTGWVLWIIWGIEAAVIVGGAAMMSFSGLEGEPYCEDCRSWADDSTKRALAPFDGVEELVGELEAEDYTRLLALAPGDAAAAVHVSARVSQCPQCRRLQVLTLERITRTKNSKGQEDTETEGLLENLLVDASVRAFVEQGRGAGGGADAPGAGDAGETTEG